MKSDNLLRVEAMNILMNTLGALDTERFISMVKRDTFDYTEWRSNLWNDKSIEEIHRLATDYEKLNNKK